MDPFALVIVAVAVVFVLWLLALGRFAPGTGLEQLGLQGSRQIIDRREALEAEDLEQLMAAHNRRRAARGQPAISAVEYELQVMGHAGREADAGSHRRSVRQPAAQPSAPGPSAPAQAPGDPRARELADRELDELLEATNARRRVRGLPERTREQARREFGAP